MFGTLFQFSIAFRMAAFVSFFWRGLRYIRFRINSPPFPSHAKTSPGAAPGSTTLFLASAVNVMVGSSHAHLLLSKRVRSDVGSRWSVGSEIRDFPDKIKRRDVQET